MRYCPHCHRFNSGWPQLCHYCNHSWYIKLCPRGHENPYDAQFCGTCGSADLTDPAGPVPWWVRLTRILLLVGALFLVLSLTQGLLRLPKPMVPFIVSIGLLLVGYHLAVSMLPNFLKRPMTTFNKTVKKGVVIALGWCWEKFKRVLF